MMISYWKMMILITWWLNDGFLLKNVVILEKVNHIFPNELGADDPNLSDVQRGILQTCQPVTVKMLILCRNVWIFKWNVWILCSSRRVILSICRLDLCDFLYRNEDSSIGNEDSERRKMILGRPGAPCALSGRDEPALLVSEKWWLLYVKWWTLYWKWWILH